MMPDILTLAARIRALEDAIRQHRDAKGHDRCWLNDKRLYRVLDGEPVPESMELPARCEFRRGCREYEEQLYGVEKLQLMAIEVFDYKENACPRGFTPWPDDKGYKPRDASWGYVITPEGRKHVHNGDQIVTDESGSVVRLIKNSFKG